jgi:hypothetical protein
MNFAAKVDALMGLFGYARVRFSQDVDTIFSVLGEFGAVKCGASGMPTASTNYFFRVRGRKVKVTVEEYEDTMDKSSISGGWPRWLTFTFRCMMSWLTLCHI